MIFIFLYNLSPSIYDAMTYFEMNVLKINYEQIGILDVMDSIGYMIGIVIYTVFLRKRSIKLVIVFTTISICAVNLLQLIVTQ